MPSMPCLCADTLTLCIYHYLDLHGIALPPHDFMQTEFYSDDDEEVEEEEEEEGGGGEGREEDKRLDDNNNKHKDDGDASEENDNNVDGDLGPLESIHSDIKKNQVKTKKKKGTMRWGVAWSFTTHGLRSISAKDKVSHEAQACLRITNSAIMMHITDSSKL